jgi:hypothetical protein
MEPWLVDLTSFLQIKFISGDDSREKLSEVLQQGLFGT